MNINDKSIRKRKKLSEAMHLFLVAILGTCPLITVLALANIALTFCCCVTERWRTSELSVLAASLVIASLSSFLSRSWFLASFSELAAMPLTFPFKLLMWFFITREDFSSISLSVFIASRTVLVSTVLSTNEGDFFKSNESSLVLVSVRSGNLLATSLRTAWPRRS